MSKYGFIHNLDETQTKRKFQVYEATLGFETVKIAVPFELAEQFEVDVEDKQPRSAGTLIRMAEAIGGGLEK